MIKILTSYIQLLLLGLTGYSIIEILTPDKVKRRRHIKEGLKHFISDKKIINSIDKEPHIEDIELYNWGFRVTLDISKVTSFDEIEKHTDYLKQVFRAEEIKVSNEEGRAIMEVVNNSVNNLDYKFIKLPSTKLLIGYDFKGNPILADMLETPHLLLTGLSGNGKTGMLRVMIKNLIANNNADLILLNGFIEDYKGFNLKHITDHNTIKRYIQSLLESIEREEKRDKPLYIVFEELGKIKDKELINLTTKLLQYGRHSKIYLIGVIQTATKEELKFKSLFNARCTFKQLEESSYRVVLGCSIDEKLRKREFYLYTNELYKGRTYNLDF